MSSWHSIGTGGRRRHQRRQARSAEVVDLRSIRPLDEETILNSVRKTHRAVLVDENKPFCGTSAQISALIMEKAF